MAGMEIADQNPLYLQHFICISNLHMKDWLLAHTETSLPVPTIFLSFFFLSLNVPVSDSIEGMV